MEWRTGKKVCSSMLTLAMVLTLLAAIPLTAQRAEAEGVPYYNANLALQYAAANWNNNDGTLCAEFVDNCVRAGGINIPIKKTTSEVYKAITAATGVQSVDLAFDSNGYIPKSLNEGKLAAGDVVYQYCKTHQVSPHIVFCGGFDANGRATFYAHNSAHNNEALKLNHNTAYQHTLSCNIVCKALHISGGDKIIGKQTVQDGRYHIVSALDTAKCLNVQGGSSANTATIELNTLKYQKIQAYDVKYIGDGFYSIVNADMDKSIDVRGGSCSSGTDVISYEQNQTDAQKWIIKESGDGTYYNIITPCGYNYLDVTGAATADGTNVQTYTGNGTNAQKWKFVPFVDKDVKGERTIADGRYHIASALDEGKCVHVKGESKEDGANIELHASLDNCMQSFDVKYLGDGYYQIVNSELQMAMDVEDGKSVACTNVRSCKPNAKSDSQKWMIKKASGDYYYIVSACGCNYLDVRGGAKDNGTNIWVYTGNGYDSQRFKFIPYTGKEVKGEQTVKDGTYHIANALDETMCLDVYNYSAVSGTEIQLRKSVDNPKQTFDIEYIGDGYYQILHTLTKNAVDVFGANFRSGARVLSHTANQTTAQKWVIQKTGDGYYNIISACGGNYLETAAGKTDIGNKIQVYAGNGSPGQKWKLISYPDTGASPDLATPDIPIWAGESMEMWIWITITIRRDVWMRSSPMEREKFLSEAGPLTGMCRAMHWRFMCISEDLRDQRALRVM